MRGTEKAPDQELKEAQDVLSWARRKHPGDSSFVIKAMLDVADQLDWQGRTAEEVDLREEIVTALRSNLGPEHLGTARGEVKLGSCLITLERYAEAEPLLSHAVEVMTSTLAEDDPEVVITMRLRAQVARSLDQTGDPTELP
jgi:hypothetical protein